MNFSKEFSDESSSVLFPCTEATSLSQPASDVTNRIVWILRTTNPLNCVAADYHFSYFKVAIWQTSGNFRKLKSAVN